MAHTPNHTDDMSNKTHHMGCGSMGSTCGTGSSADAADIKPHMDVIASCGCKVGVVDHLEGNAIKLTRNASPDDQHHFIPTRWVDHVDSHVHLNKNAAEAMMDWLPTAAACA